MELLDQVRIALRLKSNAYDPEIQTLTETAKYDLKRLNISFSEDSPEPEIVTAIILFVKSKFSNYQADYKAQMAAAYFEFRNILLLDSSKQK